MIITYEHRDIPFRRKTIEFLSLLQIRLTQRLFYQDGARFFLYGFNRQREMRIWGSTDHDEIEFGLRSFCDMIEPDCVIPLPIPVWVGFGLCAFKRGCIDVTQDHLPSQTTRGMGEVITYGTSTENFNFVHTNDFPLQRNLGIWGLRVCHCLPCGKGCVGNNYDVTSKIPFST